MKPIIICTQLFLGALVVLNVLWVKSNINFIFLIFVILISICSIFTIIFAGLIFRAFGLHLLVLCLWITSGELRGFYMVLPLGIIYQIIYIFLASQGTIIYHYCLSFRLTLVVKAFLLLCSGITLNEDQRIICVLERELLSAMCKANALIKCNIAPMGYI